MSSSDCTSPLPIILSKLLTMCCSISHTAAGLYSKCCVCELRRPVEEEEEAEEVNEEYKDHYELLEQQYEEEADREMFLKASSSGHRGGGQEVHVGCISGQNCATVEVFRGEEAKTKIEVYGESAYPSFAAMNIPPLSFGKWYFEVTLNNLQGLANRGVIGWVGSDFVPNALFGKGVGDQHNTWGVQLKSSKPKTSDKLFRINAKEKTKEEIEAEKKKAMLKAKEEEEKKQMANGYFSDDDDEATVVADDEKEEKKVEIVESVDEDLSSSHLLQLGDDFSNMDIIGCAIDFENGIMSYSHNGEWNSKWRIRFAKKNDVHGVGLRPGFSFSSSFSKVTLLFGNVQNPTKQFNFPPPEHHFAINLCSDPRVEAHFRKATHSEEFKIAEKEIKTDQDQKQSEGQDHAEDQIEEKKEAVPKSQQKVFEEPPNFDQYIMGSTETAAGKSLLLWDRPRRYRTKWQGFVAQINDIYQNDQDPSQQRNKGNLVPHLGVFGKLYTELPQFDRQLEVYLSTAATDTNIELDVLEADVHPYLRELALFADFQFAVSEMGSAPMNPHFYDLCLKEVSRCLEQSRGISFIAMLGHKAGSHCLPAVIPIAEFELLLSCAKKEVCPLLNKWYELDANCVPPHYCFRVPENKSLKDWVGSESKKGLLGMSKPKDGDCVTILANLGSFLDQLLEVSPERAKLYKNTIMENEIENGIFAQRQLLQAFCFVRTFTQPPANDNGGLASRFFDFQDTATTSIREKVKRRFTSKDLDHRCKEYNISWNSNLGLAPSDQSHKLYLRKFSNYYCQLIAESMVMSAKRLAKLAADPLMEEVAFHNSFALNQADGFVGRGEELNQISKYIRSSSRQPFIVFGSSGSGKTAIMAQAAALCSKGQEHFMIVRFCGKSIGCSTAAELMRNLCVHLGAIYGLSNAHIPHNYNALKTLFKNRLSLPTAYCPLVIFLDSLDQLNDDDQGRQLKWLPKQLPKNVRLIVSCLGQESQTKQDDNSLVPFNELKQRFPNQDNSQVWLNIRPVEPKDAESMIDTWLHRRSRTLSQQQREILLKTLSANSSARLPLFLRVVFDLACTWRSSQIVKEVQVLVFDMVKMVFLDLEKRFGKIVPAALSYLTCSKFGLSRNELEDILSLDDQVLAEFYSQDAKDLPATVRIPSYAWIQLREALKDYIVETTAQGVSVFSWLHKQFPEVVQSMWLRDPKIRKAKYLLVADYFSGTHFNGKKWQAKGPVVNRRISSQQLFSVVGRRYMFNRRRLAELPHCLMHAGEWDQLVATLSSFEFITAKCLVSSVSQLISDFTESIRSVEQLGDGVVSKSILPTLTEYRHFLVQNTSFISLNATVVFNLARNMPDNTSPCKGAIKWYSELDESRQSPWIKQIYKSQTVYPGIRQSKYDGYVTSIVYSPDGKTFAMYAGEDHVMLKFFEAESFEEISEFRYKREGAVVTLERGQKPADGVQEFHHFEEIDWHGDHIALILDNVSKVNVKTGAVVLTCDAANCKLSKCRFSADGSKIIGLGDGECVVFDAQRGNIINRYPNLVHAALSPSGSSIAIVQKPTPAPGEQCKANWCKFNASSTAKYPAYVKADNGDGTFVVQFLDGDVDRRCPPKNIHLLRDQNRLKIIDAKKIQKEQLQVEEKEEEVEEQVQEFVLDGVQVRIYNAAPKDDDRFDRIKRDDVDPNDFDKRKDDDDTETEHFVLEMCDSVEFDSTGSYLCALVPPSQVHIFKVDETDPLNPTLTAVTKYTIPCRPMLARWTPDDKFLFIQTTSTFHIVDAMTGQFAGLLQQDYIRSVSNSRLSHDCTRVLSVGDRTLKLWDMTLGWDATKPLPELPQEEEKENEGEEVDKEKEAGKRKKNEKIQKVQTNRVVGNPLELDVDARFTKDGKHVVFLSIDLSKGNPVSVIKWLPVEDLEKVPDENGEIAVQTSRLRLPVPEEDAKDVIKTDRGLEKYISNESTQTTTKNTATTSTRITKVVTTKEEHLTTVDRAPSCLAISPNEDFTVVSGVAYMGIPRPNVDVAIQLELRRANNGYVAHSLNHDADKQADPLAVRFSPDGHFLVAIFERTTDLMYWKMTDQEKSLHKLSTGGWVADFCFMRTEKYISVVANNDITLFDLAGQAEQAKEKFLGASGSCIAFSGPPHNLVAVGTEAGELLVYHLVIKDGVHKFKQICKQLAYGAEHESQKMFACAFIRNTGILATIADNVLKVFQPDCNARFAWEVTRYYTRCMLVKMSINPRGQIVIFGEGGIEPLIVTVENLANAQVPPLEQDGTEEQAKV
mmetsp:Transcript_33348/g.65546  ORF Transcript_33348/g.65546 Transcript_33348/m.65546 type:complete len:2264 (+) Transcript_33348:3350-10141(+)